MYLLKHPETKTFIAQKIYFFYLFCQNILNNFSSPPQEHVSLRIFFTRFLLHSFLLFYYTIHMHTYLTIFQFLLKNTGCERSLFKWKKVKLLSLKGKPKKKLLLLMAGPLRGGRGVKDRPLRKKGLFWDIFKNFVAI